MIPELFLIVSTVCFHYLPGSFSDHYAKVIQNKSHFIFETKCVQTVRASTSPAVGIGETAWKVVPATATTCDLVGHTWMDCSSDWSFRGNSPFDGWVYDRNKRACLICNRREQRYFKIDWTEEQ